MAEKQVTVRVDLKAGGNLGQVVNDASKQIKSLGMNMGALSPGGMSTFNNARASSAMIAGMSASGRAAMPSPINWQQVGDQLKTFTTAVGAATVAATGFALAAGPAVSQTLLGSIRLAAGEIGIILIPAVVQVSRFFQGLASTIRLLDQATLGLFGKVASAVAIPAVIIGMGAAAYRTTVWLFGLESSAMRASVALNAVAASGGTAAIASAAGGAAGTAGGIMGLAGGGKGLLGKIGIAGTAIADGSMASSTIGGTAGSAIGTGISGAGIGYTIGGPIGAAIGGGLGLIAGAITGMVNKNTAISMNFQNQSSDVGSMHDILQSEAIKDPMQQKEAEQQARAIEALAREVGLLSGNIGRNQPWQTNQ